MNEDHVRAVAAWSPSNAGADVPFMPSRVVLQDFTGVPAVVDLAAMRDGLKALGGDPARINPVVPADLVIDHSVQVDYFGFADAFRLNVEKEFERNRERYALLRWAQEAFDNFSVVPPGTGIVHQVNLEYLASVVHRREDGRSLLGVPGHPRRHGLPHHDGQRARRGRVGRRRDRGRSRRARSAVLHAPARGRRHEADRNPPGGRDRDRPRATRNGDAPRARRGGALRRVLRSRPQPPHASGQGDAREHVARVRRHDRVLPGR